MNVRERLTLAAAVAVLLASSALLPVFAGPGWVGRVALAVAVVALAGLLSRRAGLPRPLVPLAGLAALLAYVVVVFAGPTLHHGVLPGSATVAAFRALLTASSADLASYAPPAPTTPALVLLAVLGVGAAAVLVDTAAATYGRAALAGLPLLLLFAVPSGLLPGGLGWWPFALGAAGWLGLLLVEGSDRVGRWGAPLQPGQGTADPPREPAGLGRVGRRIGAAALGVAVVVPAALPGLDDRLFPGSGEGAGAGGTRRVETYNPITTLRGQLDRGEPVEVLRYTTTDQDPDYLRMTTLGEYDGNGWRQGELTASPGADDVSDGIPLPVGRDAQVPTREVRTDIVLSGELDAFWLPAPATPTRVDVEGPWLWDDLTDSVFATRARTDEVQRYSVTSSRVEPDGAQLADARGDVPITVQPYLDSINATDQVRQISEQVVSGQASDFGKAAAIQDWFQDPANRFSYSEQTETGTSPDALQDFLDNRVGYCQQYASAMAAMLRLESVPSRVAVGYTSGVRDGDDYVVTTEEAHAWPEAWISGAGWVRFEPTPPDTDGLQDPDYGPAPAPVPTASTSTGPTALPSAGAVPGETPAERARRLAAEARESDGLPAAQAADAEQGRVPWRGLTVVAAVLALLAGPAAVHALRRRCRWREPGATPAWEQVRDDAADLGHRWDDADSPRRAADRLRAARALPQPAAAALDRLSGAVERDRYAPPAAGRDRDPRALQPDVTELRRGLRAGSSRATRVRAAVLPASTVRWAGARSAERMADVLDAADSGVAAARRRVSRLRRRSARSGR